MDGSDYKWIVFSLLIVITSLFLALFGCVSKPKKGLILKKALGPEFLPCFWYLCVNWEVQIRWGSAVDLRILVAGKAQLSKFIELAPAST